MNGQETTGVVMWAERWRLASLTRDEVARIALASLIVGLGFILFHFQGNTTDIRAFGRSAILWMVERWADIGIDMSHGWMIPPVSAVVRSVRRSPLPAWGRAAP